MPFLKDDKDHTMHRLSSCWASSMESNLGLNTSSFIMKDVGFAFN